MFLSTPWLAVAKEKEKPKEGEAKKEVAVVLPTIQNKAGAGVALFPSKNKLQAELEEENALNRARLEKELAAVIAKIERLRLEKECQRLSKEIEEDALRRKHEREMLLRAMEKERLTSELELSHARFMRKMEQCSIEVGRLDKEIQLEKGKTQLLQETNHRLQAEVQTLQTKAARDNHIQKKPIYLKDPFVKKTGELILSDRCIDLNGRIAMYKADYVVDQIDFFNNKNSVYPIFIIINYCPGGDVTAGFNILQAMERSKAPVYVVVKSFAASMAALITTLAPKSFIYPNAIILHHQPISAVYANLRGTKEHYEYLNSIWQRLGSRVAKKMGISLKTFDKKLYEKSMYGDWHEFGDNAKKLKWVDCVITGIQNSAISTLPDPASYTLENFIKKYCGADKDNQIALSLQEGYVDSLSPYSFDYTYNPDKKAKIVKK